MGIFDEYRRTKVFDIGIPKGGRMQKITKDLFMLGGGISGGIFFQRKPTECGSENGMRRK